MINTTISNFHSILDSTFNHLIGKPIIIIFPLSPPLYFTGYCLKTKGETHETSISKISTISSLSSRSYDLSFSLNESTLPLCLVIQKVKACKSMQILSLEMSIYMYQNKTHFHANVIMVGREPVNGHEVLLNDRVKFSVPVDIKFA